MHGKHKQTVCMCVLKEEKNVFAIKLTETEGEVALVPEG